MLLCIATLLLKLLVPTGYMIGGEHGRMAIELCPGVASGPMAMAMAELAGPAPDHGDPKDHGNRKDHGKAEMPCAFAGLSAASHGAVDPIGLAALFAFIAAVGLSPLALPAVVARTHLRPPMRGPPGRL